MEHIKQTIDTALIKLKDLERDVAQTRDLINRLRAFIGEPPMFETTQTEGSPAASGLKGDEYVGKVQQTAIRTILERRKGLGLAPSTLDEIYTDLKAGGYVFDTRDDEMGKRGVYNTLARSSGNAFFRLSNGKWGLMSWYPGVKKKKAAADEKPGSTGGPNEPQEPAEDSTEPQEPAEDAE